MNKNDPYIKPSWKIPTERTLDTIADFVKKNIDTIKEIPDKILSEIVLYRKHEDVEALLQVIEMRDDEARQLIDDNHFIWFRIFNTLKGIIDSEESTIDMLTYCIDVLQVNVEIKSKMGVTPLGLAWHMGLKRVVQFLVSKDATVPAYLPMKHDCWKDAIEN